MGFILHKIQANINTTLFKVLWKHRRFILSFWFVPVMYTFWFKPYFFLYPNASLEQFFQYVQIMSVPLLVCLFALFLYKPCHLVNRFGVVLAAITQLAAEGYGIFQYFYYYSHHAPVILNKRNPFNVFKQLKFFLENPNSWIFMIDLLLLAIGFRLLVKFCVFMAKNPSLALKTTSNYGTAKFLSLKEIRKLNNREGLPIGAIPKTTDFKDTEKLIQNIKKYGGHELIRIKSDHTTLVAPSRTGKGLVLLFLPY